MGNLASFPLLGGIRSPILAPSIQVHFTHPLRSGRPLSQDIIPSLDANTYRNAVRGFETVEDHASSIGRFGSGNIPQYMSHPIGLTLMGFSSFGDTLGNLMLPFLAIMALAGA